MTIQELFQTISERIQRSASVKDRLWRPHRR